MDINLNLLTTKELINVGTKLKLNIGNIDELTDAIRDNYEYYIQNYNINELEDLNKAYNLYKNGYILQQGCCYNVTPINYLGEDNKNMIDLSSLFNLPDDETDYNVDNIRRADRIIRILKKLSFNEENIEYSGVAINMIISQLPNNTIILDSNLNIYILQENLVFLNLPTTFLNNSINQSNNIIKLCGCNDTIFILDKFGFIYGWGVNNGLLGDENKDKAYITTPKRIMFCKSFIKNFFCGNNHLLAIDINDNLYGWGSNRNYQLLYRSPQFNSPISLDVNIKVQHAICCDTSSIILDTLGVLYAWGDNSYGQLGDKTFISHNNPIIIEIPNKIIKLAGGQYHLIALDDEYNLYVWGRNDMGQLGVISDDKINTPIKVELVNSTNIKDIYCGDNHTLILYNDGSVFASGNNNNKHLTPLTQEIVKEFTKLDIKEKVEKIYNNNDYCYFDY